MKYGGKIIKVFNQSMNHKHKKREKNDTNACDKLLKTGN